MRCKKIREKVTLVHRLVPTRIVSKSLLIITLSLVNTGYCQKRITDETRIFNEYKNAVFTIYTSDGHGTGFLVHASGLVLTNEHVVSNPTDIRVALNDSVKVAGRRVITDPEADLAVILINPSVVAGLPIPKMAPPRVHIGIPGEKVIAIGSPMNRSHVVTSGILSEVTESFVLTDASVNPGNSGGPLFNVDGEVIGVNTFFYSAPSIGSGLSGAVNIWHAAKLVNQAIELSSAIPPPDGKKFLTMPKSYFPLRSLARAALSDEIEERSYSLSPPKLVETYDTLDYEYMCNTSLFSPPFLYRKSKEADLARSAKRRGREEEAGSSGDERYNPFADLKEWSRVDGKFKPVVTLVVLPRARQSGSSFLLNMFLGTIAGINRHAAPFRGVYDFEFASDLKRVELLKDDKVQDDIVRSSPFLSLSIFETVPEGVIRGNDVARGAIVVYPVDIFAPRNGSWGSYKVRIMSLTEPRPTYALVSQKNLERIWADFEPYREAEEAKNAPCFVVRATLNGPTPELGLWSGMSVEEFLSSMKRSPDIIYEIECGQNTGSTWTATAYKYFGQRDPMYLSLERRQATIFFFCDILGKLKLNHWIHGFPLEELRK